VQTTARLSAAEVFSLLISVAAMRAARSLPFSGLADAGLAKIEKALPRNKVRDLRRFLDCLHVGQLSPQQDLSDMGTMDPALLPAFETAFLQRLCLRFSYRDAKGAGTERLVEPQAMQILPPLWYLVAWDPARGDLRHFRMDRISRPEPLEGGSVCPSAGPLCSRCLSFPRPAALTLSAAKGGAAPASCGRREHGPLPHNLCMFLVD
jgi:predicted DNA-binding transcriptional regulator YafY